MKTLEAKPSDQNAENWKRENRPFTSTVPRPAPWGKSNRYAHSQKSSKSLIRFRCSNSCFLLATGIAGHERLFLAKLHPKAEKKTAKTAVFRHRWQAWKVVRSIAAELQRPRTPRNCWCSFAFFESSSSFDISIKNSVQRWSSDFQGLFRVVEKSGKLGEWMCQNAREMATEAKSMKTKYVDTEPIESDCCEYKKRKKIEDGKLTDYDRERAICPAHTSGQYSVEDSHACASVHCARWIKALRIFLRKTAFFAKEKERSETKKRTKEEEVEKEGRRSGWDAEKILKGKAAQPVLNPWLFVVPIASQTESQGWRVGNISAKSATTKMITSLRSRVFVTFRSSDTIQAHVHGPRAHTSAVAGFPSQTCTVPLHSRKVGTGVHEDVFRDGERKKWDHEDNQRGRGRERRKVLSDRILSRSNLN